MRSSPVQSTVLLPPTSSSGTVSSSLHSSSKPYILGAQRHDNSIDPVAAAAVAHRHATKELKIKGYGKVLNEKDIDEDSSSSPRSTYSSSDGEGELFPASDDLINYADIEPTSIATVLRRPLLIPVNTTGAAARTKGNQLNQQDDREQERKTRSRTTVLASSQDVQQEDQQTNEHHEDELVLSTLFEIFTATTSDGKY